MLVVLWPAWSCSPAWGARDLPPSQRYFYELRQRRLFSLAEDACRQMLANDDLSPPQRVALTIELSRCFAEHAKFVMGEEQRDLWQRAVQVVDDQLTRDRGQAQRLRLSVQKALVLAGRGEFLRWQVELSPFDSTLRNAARSVLRMAIEECKTAQPQLAKQLLKLGQRAALPGELARDEIRQLQSNVRFRQALALLDYAELFDMEQAERVAAVIDAEALFRRLAGGQPEQVLTQRSQLMLVKCRRLRGQTEGLADRLQKLSSSGLAELQNEIAVEHVRVLLSTGRLADAVQITLDRQRAEKRLTGELHFLRVLALLESWNLAVRQQKVELAADLMSQVRSATDKVKQEDRGYWAVRCEHLLAFSQDVRKYGPGLAHQVRQATAEYVSGKTAEALVTYRKVIDDARKSGRLDVAADVSLTYASIQLKANQLQAAEQSFRKLLAEFAANENTPRVHLLWAYALGRLYDQERTEQRRVEYNQALQTHQQQYSGSPTRFEAMWMQARLEERRLQFTKALALYQQIPADHRRAADAQTHAARCYEHILRRLDELGRPVAAWRSAARQQLRGMVLPSAEDDQLGLLRMELYVRLARILLGGDPDFSAADQLLQRVLDRLRETAGSASNQDAAYRTWLKKLATQLRIVSLAGQGRSADARALVKHIAGNNASEVLLVLDGLSKLEQSTDSGVQAELGELQLQTALALDDRRGELSAADNRHLDECLAQAYLATRQPLKAMEVYSQLLKRFPRDPVLLETAATMMMDIGSSNALQQAKQHWRTVESLQPAGGAQWLDARYQVARCCFLLREYVECRRLLDLTRLLYPDAGGPQLRERFASLERELAATQR